MANKPIILSDNLFDGVVLHPTFSLSSNGDDAAYHEPFRVADNLRDLTYWTPTTTNADRYVQVDCGASTAATCLILDRGHNLAGKTVTLQCANVADFSSITATPVSGAVPSSAGGLPTDSTGCRTAEGVVWWTFSSVASRYWRLTVSAGGAGYAPQITGLYLGVAYRFPEFLSAPAAYDYRSNVRYKKNEISEGGVRVKSRPLVFDELDLAIEIEDADYAAWHTEITRLLRYNHPWWFCLDDSTTAGAQLLRPFQTAGDVSYDPAQSPVHRKIRLPLELVMPELVL